MHTQEAETSVVAKTETKAETENEIQIEADQEIKIEAEAEAEKSIKPSDQGMMSILNKSQEDLLFVEKILSKEVPTYRQAYSDRTAWLMACLAELAYLRFNPLFSNDAMQSYFDKNVTRLIKDSRLESIHKLIKMFSHDPVKEKALLESDLSIIRLKLDKTFDNGGSQAIMVSTDEFVVLAFRGTESTCPRDIKSDFRANRVLCASGGMVHSGFSAAYEQISFEIERTLALPANKHKPLFITGHSLGGALATIAAKRISHQGGIAACYTFGSPRVGDAIWMSEIKAPLYRIVNAADCVTMMPPGGEMVELTSKILSLLPFCRPFATWFQKRFGDYLHSGDMRYLTNCVNGNYEQVSLLYSVSWLYRIMGVWKNKIAASNTIADHSMSIYRKKLAIIARKRNLD